MATKLWVFGMWRFQVLRITGLLLLMSSAVACTSTGETKGDEDQISDRPVYYGGEKVGYSEWIVNRIEFSATDYFDQDIIREEIEYDGRIFVFEFIFEGSLVEIRVLNYGKEKDEVIPASSYSLLLEEELVIRRYLDTDGESVIRTERYSNETIVSNTRDLFAYVSTFIGAYYFRESRAEPEEQRIQSLGYDLIAHERL